MFRFIILATFSLLTFNLHASNLRLDIQLYTISDQGLVSGHLKKPFNLFTDLTVRFGNFYETTYDLTSDELYQYMQQPNYQRQSILRGVDLTKSAEIHAIKRDIYKQSYLPEDEFIRFAGAKIKAEAKTFEERVLILSAMLDDMNFNYDPKRTQGIGSAEVSITDIAQALDQRFQGGEYNRAGVCRDMHQGVLKIAREAGIAEAFGVSFISMGAPHLNLILTDPDNPKRVINLNYGEIVQNENARGNSLLTQNNLSPSLGLGFYLWNADNRVELYIPSDKGVMLYKGSDGDLEELNLELPDSYQKISIETKTRLGKFALFYGNASAGDKTQVVSFNQSMKDQLTKYIESDFGHSLFYSQRPIESLTDVKTKGYFLRSSLRLGKKINFSNSQINLYLSTLIYAAIFHATFDSTDDDYSGQSNVRFDLHGSIKTGIDYRYEGENSIFNTKLELHLLPQTQNIATFSQYNIMSPGFELMESGLFLTQNLQFFTSGKWSFKIGHKLSFYPIDGMPVTIARLFGQLSYKDQTSLTTSLVKCLSDFCPAWMPGSQGRITNDLTFKLARRFHFGINNFLYEDGNYFFGLNFSFQNN